MSVPWIPNIHKKPPIKPSTSIPQNPVKYERGIDNNPINKDGKSTPVNNKHPTVIIIQNITNKSKGIIELNPFTNDVGTTSGILITILRSIQK